MRNREGEQLAVLIVEDDLDAQATLQDILELDGYEVALASSTRDVAVHDDLSRFAAIVLDRKLPDGNGDELLPHIRLMAPETEVILVTGYADLNGAVLALRHGAADFLLKPIEPEMLRFRLHRIGEQHRMRRELADAQQKLIQSERLAAIGQTVTALSHEARNELHVMHMALTLLPQMFDQRESALRMVDQLKSCQDRLHRLFEDVRGFAAPIQLETGLCNLPEIWRKAWSSLESAWKGRDVSFEEENPERHLTVKGDAFRLEQVFRNVFENALAACSDPVVIGLSCSHTHDDQSVRLTIRDNGPGLSQEQQQKIFEAFFTTKSQGTGLGMAIVKRIIEAHGGTIELGEEAIQGAEFVITLPKQHHNPAREALVLPEAKPSPPCRPQPALGRGPYEIPTTPAENRPSPVDC